MTPSPTAGSAGRSGPPPEAGAAGVVAYEVTKLLHDNITEGTGTAAYTGCAGQAGKDWHHRRIHRRPLLRLPAQPGDRRLGWLPGVELRLELSSVHGITVFGGTFPAEIWHSLYSNGASPAKNSSQPENPISWAPYYGRFTQASPSDTADSQANGGD